MYGKQVRDDTIKGFVENFTLYWKIGITIYFLLYVIFTLFIVDYILIVTLTRPHIVDD
jgi:hypothetical protein